MLNQRQVLKSTLFATGAFGLSGKLFAASERRQPSHVKITDVKPYVFKKATFVKIETDAGVSGWGEGDHENPKLTAATIDDVCKKELTGE